ncbi:MAG: VOC family protein [Phycisphaera sp.]|nr:MAG: VOC family protein [Phycisphaera sp.]
MHEHEKIDYVEFGSRDIERSKAFFRSAFGWDFEDFGPEYTAFTGEGLDGGFFKSEMCALTESGSALIVFYSSELEGTKQKVENAGGEVVKPVFSFPGGRRFHFVEPGGNEFAVWSDQGL